MRNIKLLPLSTTPKIFVGTSYEFTIPQQDFFKWPVAAQNLAKMKRLSGMSFSIFPIADTHYNLVNIHLMEDDIILLQEILNAHEEDLCVNVCRS